MVDEAAAKGAKGKIFSFLPFASGLLPTNYKAAPICLFMLVVGCKV